MSDYGFKTHDDLGNIAINAKNPIFGFDIGHNPRAFKTFKFTFAETNPIHTGSVATPDPAPAKLTWGWAQNTDSGEIRVLIKKVKHGYNFRPVGYATITGNFKVSSFVKIEQTQRAGSYGGNYAKTLTKSNVHEWDLVPNQYNKSWFVNTGIYYPGSTVSLTASDFSGTTWAYEYPKSVFTQNVPWGLGSGWEFPNGEDIPMEVEFDDEYIYFYRKYTWTDTIRRCQFILSNGVIDQDIQERVKVVSQFTGSQIDVTVYLCPFPLKELL